MKVMWQSPIQRILMLLTAGAIGLACGMPAVGAEPPDVAVIGAALQQQENASVDVVFRTSERPVDTPNAPEAKDFIEYHYIRTPDVLWLRETFNTGSKEVMESSYDRTSREHRSLTTQQDGRKQANIRHGVVVGGLQQQSLMDPVRYPPGMRINPPARWLYEWIKYATVGAEMEGVNGHSCWKLVIPDPTPHCEKFEIWVDPDIGFCPRQVDILRKGIGRVRAQFDDYTEITPGVWFPRLQVLDLPKTQGMGATIQTNRVKELKGGGTYPKETLLVKIPSGTRLYIDDATEPIAAP
jgi:hypothetical protein